MAVFVSDFRCDPTLYSIVFGESVLNDAISIVLFSAFKNFLSVELDAPNICLVLAEFVGIAIGSAVIGVILGLVCSLIFKNSNLKALPSYETLILLIMAYGSFAVGEALSLSGVMSLFFCGVILSHYNFYNLSDAARVSSKTLFHSIALVSAVAVFGVRLYCAVLISQLFCRLPKLLCSCTWACVCSLESSVPGMQHSASSRSYRVYSVGL